MNCDNIKTFGMLSLYERLNRGEVVTKRALATAIEQGRDGKLLIAAIARQFIHMGSDFFTQQGRPYR